MALAISAASTVAIYIWVVLVQGDSGARHEIVIGGLFATDRRLRDRLLQRPGRRAPDHPARGGGAQDRRRRLRQPHPRRHLGAARQARPHLQRNAAAPGRARRRPQAVRRQRLARAAHADLQPRRLRRAARGGGPEPRGAGGVRPHHARADRAADEADHRPARPLPARRRGDRRPGRLRRPQRPRPRRRARVRPARRPARLAARAAPPEPPGDRQRRPGAGAPDHPYPARQRPHPHPRGHQGDRDRQFRQPPRRADRLRRRAGHPPARPGADLRALLHGGTRRRLRARPGDRPRARAAHARADLDHLEQTLHRLHARPAAGRGAGAAARRRRAEAHA